ncbi:MAG: beta-galactosidase trimerization domain-containing protein [Novosphingobium sp.]|nr:beta-galactosidase trimerization domain-containing protein [Novosphingobium sp.]
MSVADDRLSWWEMPYRIVQTNLRLTDARLDPDALARQVRDFGATVVTFNVGGIYAWYPTELALQARNPFLEHGCDLTGEMLHAAHRAGLKIVGRYDLSKGTRIAYEAHPEWFVHNKAGKPQEYNGTYQACVNGGWAKEYGLKILEESLPRYDLDGVFFNMTGYQPYDYGNNYRGICHCRNCQDGFAAMFGRELPEREDFSDPAYPDYLLFKKRTSRAASQRIYDTVKRLRPGAGVMGNGRGSCDFMRLELQRAVGRPAPEWPHQAGELCRWGAARNRGMAYATASTNFLDYQWRYASETAAHHLLRFGQTIAAGGQIDYYLLGLFEQDNAAPLDAVRAFMHWHKANEEHLGPTRSLAKVGLYHSRATELHSGATDAAKQQTNAFRGAYRALLEGRVPFDFVSDERMCDADIAEQLAAYDVIVLPNVACLGDGEAAALDAFVEQGGTLVATGETGAYDERGRRRERFALASFPATRLSLAKNGLETYIEIGADELNIPRTRLLHLDGWYFYHDAKDDAERLLRLLPPPKYGPPELCFAEMPATDNPGVLSRRHGCGRVHYLPWLPEWLYFRDGLPDHRELLLHLVGGASRPEVKLTGAGTLEVTVRARDESSGCRIVHIVNYAGQRGSAYEEPPALHGLRLGVRNGGGAAKALVAGVTIEPGAADDDYAWLDLPPIRHFEVLVLSAGEP